AAVREHLKRELRPNTYDPATGTITISSKRAEAIADISKHYRGLFRNDPEFDLLRDYYAIPANTIKDDQRMEDMLAFFFWSSWVCATDRPGTAITYTNNWPAEPLIDNRPTGSIIAWSIISVITLLAGVGALAWYHAAQHGKEDTLAVPPKRDPMLGLKVTPSMKATRKYFLVVAALFLSQVGLGALTAHYGVEGHG